MKLSLATISEISCSLNTNHITFFVSFTTLPTIDKTIYLFISFSLLKYKIKDDGQIVGLVYH